MCGKTEPEDPVLDLEEGRICCRGCRRVSSGVLLDSKALEAMRYVVSAPAKRLFSFRLEGEGLHRLADLTEAYLHAQLERGFRTLDFYKQNKDKFDLVRSLLADERSKEVYDKVIEYKITGSLAPLFESECDPDEPMRDILSVNNYKVVCDLGAYNGDTARQILSLNADIEKVYALEPDRRTFKKLSAYADIEPRVFPLNLGAWDKAETLSFSDQGNRNSGVGMGKGTADLAPLDSLVNEKVDYIKYDVEGSEKEAINGAKGIILRDKPEMLVSLYHRSEDLFALPLQIHALRPDYRMYLRRFPYIPAWDLNLYCV